jgi:hypothetical protein
VRATGFGWAWLGALLGLLAVLACEREAPDSGEPDRTPGSVVLARVGDEVVTEEDLGWIPAKAKPASRLETLVMRKLAANEARRRGLDEEPSIRAKIADFRRNELTWEEGLLRNALFNSIRLGLTLSEDELRAHYVQTQRRYTEPQWKLRIRRFASEAEARAAVEALGATGRLDPADSEMLGPVPAAQLAPDLLPVLHLFKQPGDRQLLDLADGWTLIELDTYFAAAPLPFEAVREKVDQDLRAVRAEAVLDAELDKLRAEQVVIDAAALASVEKGHAERVEAVRAARAGKASPEAAPAEAAPDEAAPAETTPEETAPADAP